MMMCNAQPRFYLPVLIPNDAGFVLIMALFAFSNGYLSVVPFSQAPRYYYSDYNPPLVITHYISFFRYLIIDRCVDLEEQETASSLMAAALGIGLAIGGAVSNGLVRVL